MLAKHFVESVDMKKKNISLNESDNYGKNHFYHLHEKVGTYVLFSVASEYQI